MAWHSEKTEKNKVLTHSDNLECFYSVFIPEGKIKLQEIAQLVFCLKLPATKHHFRFCLTLIVAPSSGLQYKVADKLLACT